MEVPSRNSCAPRFMALSCPVRLHGLLAEPRAGDLTMGLCEHPIGTDAGRIQDCLESGTVRKDTHRAQRHGLSQAGDGEPALGARHARRRDTAGVRASAGRRAGAARASQVGHGVRARSRGDDCPSITSDPDRAGRRPNQRPPSFTGLNADALLRTTSAVRQGRSRLRCRQCHMHQAAGRRTETGDKGV